MGRRNENYIYQKSLPIFLHVTPVYQTKHNRPDGNCFAACVASLLDRKIEDVDVDVASCSNSLQELIKRIEQKANCKIYTVSHEAILDGIVRTSERYCFAAVCSFIFDGNPHYDFSVWHVVVCQIESDGRISLVFNPDQNDQRQQSLQQFSAVDKLFLVKANPIS
jgi:hypothetical protein